MRSDNLSALADDSCSAPRDAPQPGGRNSYGCVMLSCLGHCSCVVHGCQNTLSLSSQTAVENRSLDRAGQKV